MSTRAVPFFLLTSFVVALSLGSTQRQAAAQSLSSEEIRAKLVGHTISGTEDGESYTEYLAPNGTISGRSPSGAYSGRWDIVNNSICLLYRDGEADDDSWDCNRVRLQGNVITWDDNSTAVLGADMPRPTRSLSL